MHDSEVGLARVPRRSQLADSGEGAGFSVTREEA